MPLIPLGIHGMLTAIVEEQHTAAHIGSGSGGVRVLATPAMIAWMETACRQSVEPYLEKWQVTVGIHVNVRHLTSAPQGMLIRTESELVSVKDATLVFRVTASDSVEKIGEGTHKRLTVNLARFQQHAGRKLQANNAKR